MTELDPHAQRAFAVQVVEKLRAAGYEALWAGGCVRDQLLGRTPKDYDVATNARPEQVRELFGRRGTIAIGAAFGVISVLGRPKSAGQIEVATFREDASYSDGRRPDAVTFSSAEADAARRDFTINGLFYDPLADKVIDYVGGRHDLQQQLVRAIGAPADRIAEDKLRMLRAIRFAATFGFALEEQTRAAIQAMAGQVTIVSVERIATELRLMLSHPSRARAAALLAETGLMTAVFPELASVSRDAWHTTLGRLGALTPFALQAGSEPAPGLQVSFPLAFATLLHASAKISAAMTICRRLKLANKESDRVEWLLRGQNALLEARSQPWPQIQRLLIHPGINDLLAMHQAIHPASADDLVFCREKLVLPPEILNPPPFLTGDHLRDNGIPPGPEYQHLLDSVRDAQLTGQVHSSAEAIALALQLWQRQ